MMKRGIFTFVLLAAAAQAELVNRTVEIDPVAAPVVNGIVEGTQPLDGVLLDRQITSWSDIGLTYTDAVRLNSAVTVFNDSVWTGWITTGDLLPDNTIFLTEGETLESPLQSRGVARFDIAASSAGNGTGWTAGVYAGTNGIGVPYQGSNGVLRITCGNTMPGQTPGVTVHAVEITGYSNAAEAEDPKTVSGLKVIEEPAAAESVTPKWYVDRQDAADRAAAATALGAYATDPAKTLTADRLNLGNYTVVGSGAWRGVNFAQSSDSATMGTRFDDDIITLDSGLSVVEIQSSSEANGTATLQLYAQNIIGNPVISVTTNLVSGAWTSASAAITNLGGGYFTATVDVSGAGSTGFFRASGARSPASAGAVTINAEKLAVAGKVVFTNGWSIQCTTNGLEFIAP
jgi:hypothetical protein